MINPTLMHDVARQIMNDNLKEAKAARLAKQAQSGQVSLTSRVKEGINNFFDGQRNEPVTQQLEERYA